MDDFWWLIVAGFPPLEVIWVLVAALYIILQRRSAHATMAWIFALAFFPLIGIVVYVLVGPRRYERRKERRARALDAVGECATDIDERLGDKTASMTQLARMLESAVGPAGRPRRADVRLFLDGRSKFDALEQAIGGARSHVHMEYYIWEPDGIGRRLRDLLTERAAAGVEVRVLVDGFGSSNAHEKFWRPLREAGGQVRRFNEVSLLRWRPRMVNFRTHRKIAVIDGVVGFTGGMNVTDVHTREFSGDEAWRDTHLELKGSAVRGLQIVFFEDWHYAGGDAPNVEPYLTVAGADEGEYVVQIVSSGPDESVDAIHKLAFASITAAKRRVLLTTPYFVPDSTVIAALTTAALGGVDVRVLVPREGDQPFVAAAARSYYPELIEMGVKIYELPTPVLHSKTLVVDDLAVVGTANTDNRSFRLNFEVVAAMQEPALADRLADAFEQDLAGADAVTRDVMDKASLRTRLVASVARLFSPML